MHDSNSERSSSLEVKYGGMRDLPGCSDKFSEKKPSSNSSNIVTKKIDKTIKIAAEQKPGLQLGIVAFEVRERNP